MKRSYFTFFCMFLLLAGALQAQTLKSLPPAVYDPAETVFGMSYGEWSASWWQYALAFQNGASPIPDTTGQFCNSGQGGPVFFLAGAWETVERSCTVPAGKAIFIPLINVECSSVEPDPFYGPDGQKARACAAVYADGIGLNTLKLTVDGRKLSGLEKYRVQSSYYSFVMPATDNYLGVVGPTSGWSLSDGYWVMLKPLSPGTHVIHFEGAFVSGPGAGGSPQNVTYNLTVE